MNQTRGGAFKEALINVGIGYTVGLASQIVLFPLVDINVPLSTNLELSVYFTIVAIARTYLVRRWANARLRRQWLQQQASRERDTSCDTSSSGS